MLAILDLDGTILSINSFRPWALFMLRGRFAHLNVFQRAQIAAQALIAIAARKILRGDHDRLKWRLQRLWQTATAADNGASEQRLVTELQAFVRPELVGVLAAVSAHKIDAVMATAAAGDYAYGLGRALGFTHILATPPDRAVTEPHTCGPQKLAAVIDFISQRNWQGRWRVLFTDHPEDLPLIRACDVVYWFGTGEDRALVERAAPGVQIKDGFSEQLSLMPLTHLKRAV